MSFRNPYLKMIFILAAIIAICGINVIAFQSGSDDLRLYDSSVSFKHFDYQLYASSTLKKYDKKKIVTTVFKTKVIENKYLKVTLLPEFGGRILSIIYKPTGHEELYQNPIGTPYSIDNGVFYYNWLMVYGGIFPTFPEPEHGKTWCLPWKVRIVSNTPDEISVAMSFTDNLPPFDGVSFRYVRGETGITCVATVSVYKNKPYVKLGIKLINPRSKTVKYEYWTCTTLAPGSRPGKTQSPGNTEMVAPTKLVRVQDESWPWMRRAEKRAKTNEKHIFEYRNLAKFSNWADMGIAYAYPEMTENWWGVINHRNEEGIFRIADNVNYTPGLKFWTWGYRQSYLTNPKTFGNSARPYIELWAGNSRRFFTSARMKANEIKSWDEYYIPTVGLPKVSYANQHALVHLDCKPNWLNTTLNFSAMVFTTHPDETLRLSLRLSGPKKITLLDNNNFKSDPKAASKLNVSLAKGKIPPGKYRYQLILRSATGEILTRSEIPVKVQ